MRLLNGDPVNRRVKRLDCAAKLRSSAGRILHCMKLNTATQIETKPTERKHPGSRRDSSEAPDPLPIPNLQAVKAAQKATWEAGDFGEIARTIEDFAEDFMTELPLRPGARVLDAACGTGNLAVIAARRGCDVSGIDIASNLIVQARVRAAA